MQAIVKLEKINKAKPIIILILILIGLVLPVISTAAHSFLKMNQFDNTIVILEKKEPDQNNVCHLILKPYKTNEFAGKINNPIFIITYKNKREYTVSFSVLDYLHQTNGLIIDINHIEYALNTVKYRRNAISYSSAQDVAIINDFISGPDFFKVYAKSEHNDFNVFYFNTKGIMKAILYMEKYCG